MAVSIEIQPSDVQFSRNPIWFRLKCTNFASQENYHVGIQVSIAGSNLPEVRQHPNANGDINVNVQDIVDAHLESISATILPNMLAPTAYAPSSAQLLVVTYVERYGAPPIDVSTGTSASIPVLRGGVDALDFAGNTWWSGLPASSAWASWWPHNRKVARNQPNWLGWFNKGLKSDVVMEVEAFDALNVAVPATSSQSLVAFPNQPVVFAVGVEQLALPATVEFYRVRFVATPSVGGAAVETDWVEYDIDHLPHRTNRYLIAMNVWGVPEVIRCTGNRVKQFGYNPMVVTRPLALGYARSGGNMFQVEHNQSTTYTYRTGYIHQSEVDVIGGLLGIGQMWEIENGGLRRVLPKGLKTHTRQEDEEEVHVAEFVVERSLHMINYTPNPDDDANDDSPYWLLVDNTPYEQVVPGNFWKLA